MQADYLNEVVRFIAIIAGVLAGVFLFRKMYHSDNCTVEGEVVKKFEIPEQILHECSDFAWSEASLGFPVRIIPQRYIVIVKCSGRKIEIPVGQKKYDLLKVGDIISLNVSKGVLFPHVSIA